MQRAALPLARLAHVFLSTTLLAALLFACNEAALLPFPGQPDFAVYSRVPVPGGNVNAAGGNYFHERTALALDTRLGPFALSAVYNSMIGWLFNVDVSYVDGELRDASGAFFSIATVPAGGTVPGTHWVKLDGARVKTKGGLVHEFDPSTGRLLAMYWSSAPYPRLRFAQTQIGLAWRTSAVEQCTSASACTPVFALQYDAEAHLVRVDDRAGRTALLSYESDKLVSFRDGLDVEKGWPGERYTYSGNFLASLTSSENERVEIESDEYGRTTAVRGVGAGDPTWRFSHGLPSVDGIYTATVTDPLGAVTAYALDDHARTLELTNPLGERTQYTWSELRPTSRILPDGTRTTWTWENDDVATETQPSGNVRTFTYQANGVNREAPQTRALLALSDSLGVVERRGYDVNGRLTSVANGAGETTRFSYDALGALAALTLADGRELRFSAHGEHGWPSFATYGTSSDAAVSSYDAVGNRVRGMVPDPESGGVKQRSFDANRNLAALEVLDAPAQGQPGVGTVVLERRSDGQLARVLRPGGATATRFEFDARGQVVAIAEAASPGTTPQPSAQNVTTLSRDLLGRVVAVQRANGMREEITYDAVGRVVRRRTLLGGVPESDVSFEFAQGRLVRARDGAGFDEAFVYDSAGRPIEITHSEGDKTRFGWDARSRITQTSFSLAGGAPLATLTQGYDAAGRAQNIGYLGANLVTRTYVGGRLERAAYANGVRQQYYRNTQTGRAAGRELWRGTQRLEKSDYSLEPWPGGAVLQLRSQVANGTSADATTQEDFTYATLYGQNAMERRVSSSRSYNGAPTERMLYDSLSNFAGGTGAGMMQVVAYNAERNRVLTATRPATQYVPGVTSAFSYDAAGFTTAESFSLGSYALGANRFAWNARGQLVAVDSDGARVASFAYDALGRRRERTLSGTTKRWRFGGLVETSAAGTPIAIDLGEVRIVLTGLHLYRHPDLRGNPKHVTDSSGRVVRHNAYSAYGQTATYGSQADDVSFAGGTPISTPRGAYALIGARLYAPALARFLAPDPVWNPLNLYAYTFGNSIDFSDPSGLHAGSHHDLFQAKLGVFNAMAGYAGALLLFVTAPVGVPTIVAALAMTAAAGFLVNQLVELHQQSEIHREQTGRESKESRGPGGFGSPGGFGGFGGGGATSGPRAEVCSIVDGDVMCTSTPIGGAGSGGLVHSMLF